MIQHVWTVFCSSSAIDRDTNQVSLFDLIEQIAVQAVEPRAAGERGVIPARFQVVTLWTRGEAGESESAPGRLRFIAPNGEELLQSEYEVDLTAHLLRRTRINLAGIPYAGDGRYRFRVELRTGDEWRVVGDVPVQLAVQSPPTPEQPDQPEPVPADH